MTPWHLFSGTAARWRMVVAVFDHALFWKPLWSTVAATPHYLPSVSTSPWCVGRQPSAPGEEDSTCHLLWFVLQGQQICQGRWVPQTGEPREQICSVLLFSGFLGLRGSERAHILLTGYYEVPYNFQQVMAEPQFLFMCLLSGSWTLGAALGNLVFFQTRCIKLSFSRFPGLGDRSGRFPILLCVFWGVCSHWLRAQKQKLAFFWYNFGFPSCLFSLALTAQWLERDGFFLGIYLYCPYSVPLLFVPGKDFPFLS